MYVSDEWIERIMLSARVQYLRPVRLQITAGWGCTVVEIYERDAPNPQIPLVRELLGA